MPLWAKNVKTSLRKYSQNLPASKETRTLHRSYSMASQLENKYAGIAEALKEVQKQITPIGLGKSLIKITTKAITFEDLPKFANPEIQNIEEELIQPLIIHNLPNKSILRISQTPRERIQELAQKLHRSNPRNNLSTLYKLYLLLN